MNTRLRNNSRGKGTSVTTLAILTPRLSILTESLSCVLRAGGLLKSSQMQTYGGEKLEKQAFVVYSERGSRGREREMRIS